MWLFCSSPFLLLVNMSSQLYIVQLLPKLLNYFEVKTPEHLGKGHDVLQCVFITYDPVPYPSPRFDNQARYIYKIINEPFELHSHYLKSQFPIGHQQTIPSL